MKGFDREDGSCSCGGHAVRRVNQQSKREFFGCSNYPECRNTEATTKPAGDFWMSGDDYAEAFADAMLSDKDWH